MKKTKRLLPRLLCLALICLLALTAVLPLSVFAEDVENLTVTIHNNEGLPAMKADQFTVYQLFTGRAHREGEPGVNEWDAWSWNNYTLADIEWGASLKTNSEALLTALKALNAESAGWAFADGTNVFANVATAADLAKALVGRSNDFLQHFSSWLVNLKTGGPENETPVLEPLELPEKGEDGAVTNPVVSNDSENPAKDTLTYKFDDPGYYLFADTHVPADVNDAVSEYILAVLGAQDINLKASIPTVDKNILDGGNDNTTKGDAAGIGDTVIFQLTGTLARNFHDFDTYFYAFHDTLSKGLTYKDSLVVTVKRATITYTIDPNEYKVETKSTPDGKTSLDVTFENLRKEGGLKYTAVEGPEGPGDYEQTGTLDLGDFDTIYVTYKAELNGDAVIGAAGNPNDVYLEYSNDPNSDGKGKTEEKTVYVYTFGLDLHKVGSDTAHESGLEGAGFVLSKEVDGETLYATFEDVTDEETGAVTGRRLTGWLSGQFLNFFKEVYKTALEDYEKASNEDRENPDSAVRKALDAALAGLDLYLLTSGADGAIPDVTGLDEGSYTLTEVVVPDGYNTMDPFTFRIDAILDEAGKLTRIDYYQPANSESPTASYDSTTGNAIFESGLLPETLVNQKAPFLPFTGGIGTLVFYVLGGALIAGAVVYLVVSAKKRKKPEDKT